MFLAIIIPPARKNRVVAVLVMRSLSLSFACGCLPGIASLSDGTRTILLTVLISCGAAVLFPVTPEAPEAAGTEEVRNNECNCSIILVANLELDSRQDGNDDGKHNTHGEMCIRYRHPSH